MAAPIKPKKVERRVDGYNMKAELHDWIKEVSEKQGISRSRFVETMVETLKDLPPDFMVELMKFADGVGLPLSVVIANTLMWRLIFLTAYRKVNGKNAPDSMQEFYIRSAVITDDKGNREEFQGIPTGEIAVQIFEMVLTEALEKDKEVREKLHATAELARKHNSKIGDIPVAEVIDNFLEHAI